MGDPTHEVLFKAMKGLGTDEQAIYDSLESVDSQHEWASVQWEFRQAHPDMCGGDLVKAIKDEMNDKEEAKCKEILEARGVEWDPQAPEDVLYKAMKGFGTDEAAVYAAIEQVTTQDEWEALQANFKRKYPKVSGGDLRKALLDELAKGEEEKVKGILAAKGVTWDPPAGSRRGSKASSRKGSVAGSQPAVAPAASSVAADAPPADGASAAAPQGSQVGSRRQSVAGSQAAAQLSQQGSRRQSVAGSQPAVSRRQSVVSSRKASVAAVPTTASTGGSRRASVVDPAPPPPAAPAGGDPARVAELEERLRQGDDEAAALRAQLAAAEKEAGKHKKESASLNGQLEELRRAARKGSTTAVVAAEAEQLRSENMRLKSELGRAGAAGRTTSGQVGEDGVAVARLRSELRVAQDKLKAAESVQPQVQEVVKEVVPPQLQEKLDAAVRGLQEAREEAQALSQQVTERDVQVKQISKQLEAAQFAIIAAADCGAARDIKLHHTRAALDTLLKVSASPRRGGKSAASPPRLGDAPGDAPATPAAADGQPAAKLSPPPPALCCSPTAAAAHERRIAPFRPAAARAPDAAAAEAAPPPCAVEEVPPAAPAPEAAPATAVTLRRSSGERWGLLLDAALKLTGIRGGSPGAAHPVLPHLIGRTLIRVNSTPVRHPSEVAAACDHLTDVVLDFEGTSYAVPVIADARLGD